MSMSLPMSFNLREGLALNGLCRVYGEAIHPMTTFHPNEYPSIRVHYKDQLQNAAPSLGGTPWVMDHKIELPPPNFVTKGWWNETRQAVAYEGELEPYYANLIREGIIRGVSVELNWAIPGGSVAFVDGFAAKGFKFTGLSLLHELEPGDPRAFIKLVEAIYTPKPHVPQKPSEPEHRESRTFYDHARRAFGWK